MVSTRQDFPSRTNPFLLSSVSAADRSPCSSHLPPIFSRVPSMASSCLQLYPVTTNRLSLLSSPQLMVVSLYSVSTMDGCLRPIPNP